MISKEKKIELILKIAEENNLSYYDIGHEIKDVSLSSLEKIFKRRQTNPREKTLNKILEYLENKIVGTQNQYEFNSSNKPLQENPLTYKNNMQPNETQLLKEVLKECKSNAVLLLQLSATVAETYAKLENVESKLSKIK